MWLTDSHSPQNISETISDIPVYIGVQELKSITYFTLLPLFKQWSKNDTLSLEDLRLRFKNWVELVPLGTGDEDVNAISSKFFSPKGKSKTIQFHPGKGLELYLELAYSRYAEILLRLEELEEGLVRIFHFVTVLLSNAAHSADKASSTEDVNIIHYGIQSTTAICTKDR